LTAFHRVTYIPGLSDRRGTRGVREGGDTVKKKAAKKKPAKKK
jgi:hypothetical protein